MTKEKKNNSYNLSNFKTTSGMKLKIGLINEENKKIHWKKRIYHSSLELLVQSKQWNLAEKEMEKMRSKGYNVSIYEKKLKEHKEKAYYLGRIINAIQNRKE